MTSNHGQNIIKQDSEFRSSQPCQSLLVHVHKKLRTSDVRLFGKSVLLIVLIIADTSTTIFPEF